MSDRPDEVPPTDVLAAEEFGVPAPDPALRPEDLDLPEDLVGGEERDVLAAEEFAMPAPDEARVHARAETEGRDAGHGIPRVPALLAALGAGLVALARLMRRRRRRAGAD